MRSSATYRSYAGFSFLHSWSVGVVIPARNEVGTIVACINSVLSAIHHGGKKNPVWIVVVADSCSDSTASLARRAVGVFGEVVSVSVGAAGAARQIGTDAVLAHFGHTNRRRLWLANTDADSRVREDWLTRQLHLAERGCVGVAGIVQLDDSASKAALADYEDHYRIHKDGSHPHVHGANLGLRADVYIQAGGWTALALAEDHCLWNRLRERGMPLCATSSVSVITSARLTGRATDGFADCMRARVDQRHRQEAQNTAYRPTFDAPLVLAI